MQSNMIWIYYICNQHKDIYIFIYSTQYEYKKGSAI